MGVNLSNSSYDGNLLFLPLTLRLSWTLLARKYWRYFNENNCSLPEEFTQFRPATARGKVVKNVSPESTKASGSPEALPQVALALHIHWYVVCPCSHCVPLLVVSLWCCRVWNHNSEILTREGGAQSKVQVRGRRGWGHGLPPLQLRLEAGHNCQSDTAEALWALSQLPAVTVAAELFTAPELSVSSEGGGSAAALSSCTGSWLCPSPQTEVVFPFCPCQWHKGIFSPKILHNLCNFWTENRECCSHAWGGGMWKSRTNFFTSTAQSERWHAQFLPCNGVILQQIGRELGCPFPFAVLPTLWAVSALESLPLTWGNSCGMNKANTDCCHNSSEVLCSEGTLPCFSSVPQQSSEMQFCSQNVEVSFGQWPLTLLTAWF